LPWRYVSDGFYERANPPYQVRRYRCRHCHRCFSDQTFTTTYWLKRPELLDQIQRHAVSGAANRQVARILRCNPSTVDNQLARLGRHCLLVHRHLVAEASPFVDIALDGLVTFEHSKYFPFEIIAAVDRRSSFITHFADAELSRSGKMTDLQKRVRDRLNLVFGKADRWAVLKAVIEVLSVTVEGAVQVHLWTDMHRTYPRAVRRVVGPRIVHQTINSRRPRTPQNPLFEVNCLDMLLRHCLKDHTRETIAFAKRRQHSLYRVAIMLVWRNYIKLRREKRCRQTPAMVIGLLERPLLEEEVLGRRLFVTQMELPARWSDIYWRRLRTRAQAVNRGHALRYAF